MAHWEYATVEVEQDWPYGLPEGVDGPIYHEHQGHGPDGAPIGGITDLLAAWDAAGWEFVTAIRQNVDIEQDMVDVAQHEARYGPLPEGTRLWETETRELLIFRRPLEPRE